jgi:hypothetical protein
MGCPGRDFKTDSRCDATPSTRWQEVARQNTRVEWRRQADPRMAQGEDILYRQRAEPRNRVGNVRRSIGRTRRQTGSLNVLSFFSETRDREASCSGRRACGRGPGCRWNTHRLSLGERLIIAIHSVTENIRI